MSAVLTKILGGKSIAEALREDTRVIKQIGDARQARSFEVRTDRGYVTAKIQAVPVTAARKR